MEFEIDPAKTTRNLKKHKVSFEVTKGVVFGGNKRGRLRILFHDRRNRRIVSADFGEASNAA